MVQELIARLHFAADHVVLDGRRILDYGCGTGIALEWLGSQFRATTLVGMDVSECAVAFAARRCPDATFHVLSGAHPLRDLRESFDVVLCFEVLEHVDRPDRTLEHLASYLHPDGVLVASTPNRLVFSAGMEPSPINRTHIHEMDLEEFRLQLGRWFEQVDVWGMRYHEEARTLAHARNVRAACDGYHLLGERWWNPWANRFYRWIVRGGLWHLLRGRDFLRWSAADFQFEQDSLERAIWFIAVARKPRSRSART
jgi:SAM-dependent methyltransferase